MADKEGVDSGSSSFETLYQEFSLLIMTMQADEQRQKEAEAAKRSGGLSRGIWQEKHAARIAELEKEQKMLRDELRTKEAAWAEEKRGYEKTIADYHDKQERAEFSASERSRRNAALDKKVQALEGELARMRQDKCGMQNALEARFAEKVREYAKQLRDTEAGFAQERDRYRREGAALSEQLAALAEEKAKWSGAEQKYRERIAQMAEASNRQAEITKADEERRYKDRIAQLVKENHRLAEENKRAGGKARALEAELAAESRRNAAIDKIVASAENARQHDKASPAIIIEQEPDTPDDARQPHKKILPSGLPQLAKIPQFTKPAPPSAAQHMQPAGVPGYDELLYEQENARKEQRRLLFTEKQEYDRKRRELLRQRGELPGKPNVHYGRRK